MSYEWELQEIVTVADYVICGEGELQFRSLCRDILEGVPPAHKVLEGGAVDLAAIELPYELYADDDLKHRIVYVEGARGVSSSLIAPLTVTMPPAPPPRTSFLNMAARRCLCISRWRPTASPNGCVR